MEIGGLTAAPRPPQKETPAPGARLSLWVDPADMVMLTE